MQITYLGDTGFIIKGNQTSVALACKPEEIGLEEIIITGSEDDKIKTSANQAVFDWPGEYEARNVSVMVIPVGPEKKQRAVKIMIDEISIAHLDNLDEVLKEEEEEKIGNIDILLIRDNKNTKANIEAIDPRLVIPMGLETSNEKEFSKKLGFGEIEAEESLKLKKTDLPSDRMDLKILKPKK